MRIFQMSRYCSQTQGQSFTLFHQVEVEDQLLSPFLQELPLLVPLADSKFKTTTKKVIHLLSFRLFHPTLRLLAPYLLAISPFVRSTVFSLTRLYCYV